MENTEDLKLILVAAMGYLSAVTNGDGENQAIYRGVLRQLFERVNMPEDEEFNLDNEIWKIYYKTRDNRKYYGWDNPA